jgi:DNA mismatch repair protein MutS
VPVVTNDFRLSGPERIFVVTGPNHGGKTTFARMLGQIHYLASLGCPVPARRARLFLPDQVFTHFEREENLAAHRGKLEDELHRIRDVLNHATARSLVVMNESFSSTTLRDARFIGEQVLDTMTDLGLLGVYVTFVDELVVSPRPCFPGHPAPTDHPADPDRPPGHSDAIVSMVADVVPDNPAEHTFTIVRRPADGLAYAAAIAAKYGLTYRQLKQRLPVAAGGTA